MGRSSAAGAVASSASALPRVREARRSSPDALRSTFRERRFRLFEELAAAARPAGRPLRILDVGGTHGYWLAYGAKLLEGDVEVTVVNLESQVTRHREGRIRVEVGDGRRLDAYGDDAFDVVHSNSVIEHVGGWRDQRAAAAEIRRLAPAYFVQTPYFWCPYEPHMNTWLVHWLPVQLRYPALMRRKMGAWGPCPTVAHAVERAHSAQLLDRRQVEALFPDAEVTFERVAGLPKSLIAIRRAR